MGEMCDILVSMINEMTQIRRLRALSDVTRLRIVQMLACCPECVTGEECGPTASRVCCDVSGAETITSTVSHHLKELREAGLVNMNRQGKTMVCTLDREALAGLGKYLIALADTNPCADAKEPCCTGGDAGDCCS